MKWHSPFHQWQFLIQLIPILPLWPLCGLLDNPFLLHLFLATVKGTQVESQAAKVVKASERKQFIKFDVTMIVVTILVISRQVYRSLWKYPSLRLHIIHATTCNFLRGQTLLFHFVSSTKRSVMPLFTFSLSTLQNSHKNDSWR